MNQIKLSVANANGNFTDKKIEAFEKATNLAEEFISKNFDFDYNVDVIVVPPSYLLNPIPEDGICGRTYRFDLIIIVVDSKSEVSQDFFYETLCHELSHSLRWKKLTEHSITLFDNIILEGLAIVLEKKAMANSGKNNIQYFLKEMQKTDEKTINQILSVIGNDLEKNTYDFDKIFITGDNNLPRWSGYKLGYYFVNKYLKDNDCSINKATLDSYKKFRK